MAEECAGGPALRPWKRLYVVVEGPTEREFLKLVLADHLAEFEIDLKPRVTITSHDRSKRGGVNFYKTFRKDLDLVMKQDSSSDAVFSTMIDLYALPPSFPGWNDAQGKPSLERAAVLEAA